MALMKWNYWPAATTLVTPVSTRLAAMRTHQTTSITFFDATYTLTTGNVVVLGCFRVTGTGTYTLTASWDPTGTPIALTQVQVAATGATGALIGAIFYATGLPTGVAKSLRVDCGINQAREVFFDVWELDRMAAVAPIDGSNISQLRAGTATASYSTTIPAVLPNSLVIGGVFCNTQGSAGAWTMTGTTEEFDANTNTSAGGIYGVVGTLRPAGGSGGSFTVAANQDNASTFINAFAAAVAVKAA